jgi:predicted acylesterase/phospholipase RssA
VKRALVLSGGGMFGAWQAGAWRALADRFRPDLVVGASVGSLNGYAIACGATPEELAAFWRESRMGSLANLPETIRVMMRRGTPRVEYAVVLTDLLRLKPRVFSGSEITWRHLAASCAIPGVLRQYKIEGRWYSDGGLLNPLPVYAAVDLGATQILAFHPLWPQTPLVQPLIRGFVHVFGHHPPLPSGVELLTIKTDRPLGSMNDALRWRRENIDRWLELGYEAGSNISIPICSES